MPPATNFKIQDILLEDYRIASITAYNRLETSARVTNFDRSLKAEIRDPLWMLTRQWQFGEFEGDDAGSAIGTKILGDHTMMEQVRFPNNTMPYNDAIPLETIVEREKIKTTLFLAVQMGRYFIKLIKNNPSFTARFDSLLNSYPLNYTPDANDDEGNQLLAVVKGSIPDGYALYSDIVNGSLNAADASAFHAEIQLFKEWYKRTYSQPDDGINAPWEPAQLDYKFAVASSGQQGDQKILTADHYSGGYLDWYAFDLGASGNNTVTQENITSFIPSSVSFKGMPNARFWAMEDNQIDFGKIDTSPTGLLHLLFAEFGLICSNDWLMVPYPLAVNTLCEIKGILVTDVFGQKIFVRAAGRGVESNWQRWAMFHHTNAGTTDGENKNLFYLPPAITKSLEGEPLEQVNFLRDEMANMVWAVEKVVPSQAGKGVSGDEMAMKEEIIPSTPATAASVRYVLGTTVPDNWIPFIPVHIEGSNSEVRLQRAKMPGSKGPLCTILNEKPAPYYIDEEIISRSGIQVSISAQRARWYNGKTYLWFGRKKEANKGEGYGNLMFDQIK